MKDWVWYQRYQTKVSSYTCINRSKEKVHEQQTEQRETYLELSPSYTKFPPTLTVTGNMCYWNMAEVISHIHFPQMMSHLALKLQPSKLTSS